MRSNAVLAVAGLAVILVLWEALPRLGVFEPSLVPPFSEVVGSYGELFTERRLLSNAFASIQRNVLGYLAAVAVAVPLGLALGALPKVRHAMLPWVGALRFVPLAALTGFFIANFGIGEDMKVLFLAFGVGVYLVPTTVQRFDEVPASYVQAAQTMGASRWDVFRRVQLPVVLSRVFDDLRVLTAIGWTYIVLAESLAVSPGVAPGLGRLAFVLARTNTAGVYAVLIVITAIGLVQDRLFALADRALFPHKHLPAH